MLSLALAMAGAVVLWLPAFRYRIDAATCASWPALGAGAGYAAAYLVAIALLTAGWVRAMRERWTLGRALAAGVAVHLVAMVAPPFASNDPLFYAAIGRALHHFHGSSHVPLSLTLPAGDRFLALLPETWRGGTSPYSPPFDRFCALVDALAGDDVTRHLRLFQAANVACLAGAAALAGVAFGAPAAALVLFAPLAIVDGTVNPHNDAMMALAVAGFALALARRRPAAGLVALAASLLVKLSGALLFVFEALRLLLRRLGARIAMRTLLALGVAAAVAGVVAVVVAVHAWPELAAFTDLFGRPDEATPRFSRSLESLPRAFLTYVVHAPLASWCVGLCARAAAGVFLLYCALRAAKDDAPLRWAAILTFVYYLCFHAFLQSWYVLPLLPLAMALPAWMRPAFRVFVVALTAYYAVHLPLDCDTSRVVIGVKEFGEGVIVVLVPLSTLLAAWRGARARASAGTSRRAP